MKKKKSRLKSKSTIKPMVIGGLFLLGLLLYFIRSLFAPQPLPISINQVGVTDGVVDLTLTPATNTVEPGGELVLILTAKPGSYKVGDITVELNYDPAKVGTPVLTQGTYLTDKMGTPKVENGRIYFEFVASVSGGLATGDGVVATIKLFPQGSGTTTLTFTDNTEVVVVDPTTNTTIASNMLKSATGATITIGSAASSEPSTAPSTPANPQKPAKPTGLKSNCYDGGKKITLRWDAVSGASSYKLRLDQKDGNNDKSTDDITKTDYDYDILPDQKYSWWVHTTRDGVDSDEARVDEVICAKTTASITPSSTPAPTITPKPTVKPTITPTPKVTPRPSSKTSLTTPAPNLGSLNDVFDGGIPSPTPPPTTSPNFLTRIFLGWQAIIQKINEIFK